MQAELLILRLIHVVGGVFWVGTMVFNSFFLGPSLAAAGAAAGQVANQLQRRRVFTIMPITAIVTMLAGMRLMMITSSGIPGYFASRAGMTYSIGGACAIIAFLFGLAVARPAMMKAASLGAAMSSDEITRGRIESELRAVQQRARWAALVVGWLLLLSAVCMAIARYL